MRMQDLKIVNWTDKVSNCYRSLFIANICCR